MLNYIQWKEKYSYACKTWTDVNSLYGNDNRINIVMTITNKEKQNNKWKTINVEKKVITLEFYLNCVDAIPFFRSLGGKESVKLNYTRWGKIPIEIKSTSPDGLQRTIREFRF